MAKSATVLEALSSVKPADIKPRKTSCIATALVAGSHNPSGVLSVPIFDELIFTVQNRVSDGGRKKKALRSY